MSWFTACVRRVGRFRCAAFCIVRRRMRLGRGLRDIPAASVLVVVAAVADEATLTFVPHDAQKFASSGRLYPQQGHFMMVPFVAVFR
mgnify:FL=1